MENTTLGNTDIQISKLCVGCMSFGKAGTMHDWTLDETETEKVVKHALSLEINFFDTANGYSAGTSEEYLGRALKKNVARDHGWAQFQAMENHYNLLYREDERELIPICKQMGVSLIPYSPWPPGTSPARSGPPTPCAAGPTGSLWANTTAPKSRIWRSCTGCTRWPSATS